MNDDEPDAGPATPGRLPGAVPPEAELRRRLASLRVEHEDLDASVQALTAVSHPDQVRIMRLKKKKLGLRDEIARLEDALTPDIIA